MSQPREIPSCHACARPRRKGFDGCCSEACRQAFEHDRETARDRETVEMQGDFRDGRVWNGGQRLNLQNSA